MGIGAVDDVGTGTAVKEGDGRGGTAGGCGAGMVEPEKNSWMMLLAAAKKVSGAIRLPVVGVGELGGSAEIVGTAETDGIEPVVPPTADMEVAGTAGIPGAITPIGMEQVTTVPGIVGSEASGTGANVVSGTPG